MQFTKQKHLYYNIQEDKIKKIKHTTEVTIWNTISWNHLSTEGKMGHAHCKNCTLYILTQNIEKFKKISHVNILLSLNDHTMKIQQPNWNIMCLLTVPVCQVSHFNNTQPNIGECENWKSFNSQLENANWGQNIWLILIKNDVLTFAVSPQFNRHKVSLMCPHVHWN